MSAPPEYPVPLDWMDGAALEFIMGRFVGYDAWKSAKYLASKRLEMNLPASHETAVFNLCNPSPNLAQRHAALAMATLLYDTGGVV